jgi:transaldolase
MPEATLDAVADHGVSRGDTVTGSYAEAQQALDDLKAAGIDYDDVVDQLEVEAVQKFEDAWNELIESVTANLEKAGADISGDGSSSPAGSGPAAADREGSA